MQGIGISLSRSRIEWLVFLVVTRYSAGGKTKPVLMSNKEDPPAGVGGSLQPGPGSLGKDGSHHVAV